MHMVESAITLLALAGGPDSAQKAPGPPTFLARLVAHGPDTSAPTPPSVTQSDSDLVRAARRGDVTAYEHLLARHSTLAFRVAILITGSRTDAEDALQEASLRAFRALDRFRPDAPFAPWLLKIVANEARSRIRAETRRLTRQADWLRSDLPALPKSPDDHALDNERRQRLLLALDSLVPDDRLVIQLRYFLDLSTAETAAAIGFAEGTVKSRLSRALAKLRARYENSDG